MTYRLLPTGRGVIAEQNEILFDVKDGAKLSFLLQDNSQYVAVLTDSYGNKFQVAILDGIAELPKELIKPQTVLLYVINVTHEKTYICEPFNIMSFNDFTKEQTVIFRGLFSEDIRKRLTEIEQQFCTQVQNYETAINEINLLKEQYFNAIQNFNKTIEAVNEMSERLSALEANYDPTII